MIFLQDKYEYLRMVTEVTLQTIKIPITVDSDEENFKTTVLIEEFLKMVIVKTMAGF